RGGRRLTGRGSLLDPAAQQGNLRGGELLSFFWRHLVPADEIEQETGRRFDAHDRWPGVAAEQHPGDGAQIEVCPAVLLDVTDEALPRQQRLHVATAH